MQVSINFLNTHYLTNQLTTKKKNVIAVRITYSRENHGICEIRLLPLWFSIDSDKTHSLPHFCEQSIQV